MNCQDLFYVTTPFRSTLFGHEVLTLPLQLEILYVLYFIATPTRDSLRSLFKLNVTHFCVKPAFPFTFKFTKEIKGEWLK